MGTIFRSPRIDVAAPSIAGETHRRGAGWRCDLYERPSALAGGYFASIGKQRGTGGIACHKSKSSTRAANSRRAGRLVLGAQSLENAPA